MAGREGRKTRKRERKRGWVEGERESASVKSHILYEKFHNNKILKCFYILYALKMTEMCLPVVSRG